jgi:hypothetical protein
MRTKLIILVALRVAGHAHANMIPLSAVRGLSVSGTAGGSSYSQTQSFSGFGTFDGSLAGVADSTDSMGFFYHADSQASQTSAIPGDEISASLSLQGDTSLSYTSPISPVSPAGAVEARARSIFELTFNVPSVHEYSLTGSGSLVATYREPTLIFSLNSTAAGVLLDTNRFF